MSPPPESVLAGLCPFYARNSLLKFVAVFFPVCPIAPRLLSGYVFAGSPPGKPEAGPANLPTMERLYRQWVNAISETTHFAESGIRKLGVCNGESWWRSSAISGVCYAELSEGIIP